MKFNEHGNYSVKCDNDIILFKAQGVWNAESSIHCISMINSCIEKIDANKFSIVVDTEMVTGITPDSAKLWFKTIRTWQSIGHSALVRIDNPDSINYKIFLSDFDKYFMENIDFNYAHSFDDAIKWLHSMGYKGFS